MSVESAKAFYERLEKDTELALRLNGMTGAEMEKLVKRELGYDFTQEEMQKIIFEKNPEMSDEELEAVVGGFSGSDFAIGVGVGGGIALLLAGGGGTVVVCAAFAAAG